jgi:hypothetical protein
MLPGMFRALGIALVMISAGCAGCGKSASNQDKVTTPSGDDKDQVIKVPGAAEGAATKGGPTVGGADGSAATTGAPPEQMGAPADDPRFHLQPEEGTLTVDKAEGKAGAEAKGAVKVAPAKGYHVATDYPIKLTLEAPAGVKIAKTELTAGGRNKTQGDAETLSEQALAFAVKATADKAGSYEIKGTLKFGICEKDSCHPKKQPITITVAAN